ncbi:MAG TPA: VOC family protein [Gemmatimonadaceae bacterium]|nr:VOC family protein [Gemmatimonadaceae bacterium]
MTTHDLYGGSPHDEPAEPESYGLAPSGYRLPAATRLGAVRLQVADLERSLGFYTRTLGFRVVGREGDVASLAPQDDDRILVEVVARAGTRPAGRRGTLGIFHFAILLPDRASLGRFVRHGAEQRIPMGAGDHLVSEAFYLSDPDGIGIEVYADRPRSAWRRQGRELMMATDPVDVPALLEAAGDAPWAGMPPGTVIGHLHLHVGDLERGRAFYSDALGFDRMAWRYPGALFLGAGGYHHHLGTNTWAGAGARAPAEDDAKLLHWTIELPTPADLEAVRASLASAAYAADAVAPGTVMTRDPWGTGLQLRAASG